MNRVLKVAAEVLKEHQEGIVVDTHDGSGGRMKVRLVKPNQEALDEVSVALSSMGVSGANFTISPLDDRTGFDIRGERYLDHNPHVAKQLSKPVNPFTNSIAMIANKLADAGVNFPGASAHLSRSVTRD